MWLCALCIICVLSPSQGGTVQGGGPCWQDASSADVSLGLSGQTDGQDVGIRRQDQTELQRYLAAYVRLLVFI